ncbi:histidine phosphatase family protein [Demequina mangrovi]|uniref:Probable phosphoglycerate mutase n=1 Tax=Demequina mangrovi TaxID=1043493 RepID=A0A1H6VDI5_9MICO|nr:histidine phosphatase family protein [Demequina mangrovi]SEI98680.1 probable phosphoglycerate mutase [Demequina mangrovi]
MTRLFVVRHGQTDWNLAGRLQGSTDIPLNATGREQARAAASSLWPALEGRPVFVSSALDRAIETARIIVDGRAATLNQDARLGERRYGPWEGLLAHERESRFPDDHAAWMAGYEPDFDGYETHAEVAARMTAAVDDWIARVDGDLVLVAHGSSGRMLLLALLGLPLEGRTLGSLHNAAWSRLVRATGGGWSLERHNVGAPAVAS